MEPIHCNMDRQKLEAVVVETLTVGDCWCLSCNSRAQHLRCCPDGTLLPRPREWCDGWWPGAASCMPGTITVQHTQGMSTFITGSHAHNNNKKKSSKWKSCLELTLFVPAFFAADFRGRESHPVLCLHIPVPGSLLPGSLVLRIHSEWCSFLTVQWQRRVHGKSGGWWWPWPNLGPVWQHSHDLDPETQACVEAHSSHHFQYYSGGVWFRVGIWIGRQQDAKKWTWFLARQMCDLENSNTVILKSGNLVWCLQCIQMRQNTWCQLNAWIHLFFFFFFSEL